MARIDPERAQLVIRLVYDGPAQAGKTTSVRALARSLGTSVFSAAEEEGRTLYFDWADYVGGLFDGMPIRCQIVSAPGQIVLERRRRRLLESADAVVFVVDSRRARMAENLYSYAILREVAAQAPVAAGIVMQANKRDLPDALSLDELRDAFGGAISLAMTEAVAERGEGVRETFVLAIRLALDRVRALWSLGLLEQLPPDFESGAELLAAFEEDEGQEAGHRAQVTGHREDRGASSETHEAVAGAPLTPDATIPPGLVWPPVQGRVIVHEAARHAIAVEEREAGAWRGAAGGWRISSPPSAAFTDLEDGRAALIAWARWHAAAFPRLSAERAIVLAPAAPGQWRLWQIVHAPQTLLDLCRDAVRTRDRTAGERLIEVIELRARAFETLVGSGVVDELSLASVALSPEGAPVYAGEAAYPPHAAERGALRTDDALEAEILAVVREELSHAPDRLPELLASIEAAAALRGRTGAAQRLRRSLLNM